ncbi:hypothetical protein BDN72DRAFT_827493 [Pluteus cervinus]|uniref:Uncharacterized protein n=1 Tax=Pluteus cervinus TaxID=181527 RepID=A0ACD3A9Q3_9AGAR|nr:hypothetical protein BDN72DRAFT_827493 [Pluteus cervinus]
MVGKLTKLPGSRKERRESSTVHHKLEKAREILACCAIQSASFDAAERGNPPTCHPETRLAVQDSLVAWRNNPKTDPVRLISGWAGAGKSTIAQTIAEYWAERGQLAGSFFFSWSSEDRCSSGWFAETILHQLLRLIKFDNEMLVGFTDGRVSWSSVIDVLRSVFPLPSPMVIVIDGLDECRRGYDQVSFLGDILCSVDRLEASIKFLICCRPERHLETIFHEFAPQLSPSYHIQLGQSAGDNDDIRTFLRVSFDRICQDCRKGGTMSIMDRSWPSDEQIEELVDRASGQFVFAATAIRLVDDGNEGPVEMLNLVLERRTSSFASIDGLYNVILFRVGNNFYWNKRSLQQMENLILHVNTHPSSSSDIADFWFGEEDLVNILVKHLQGVLIHDAQAQGLIQFRHKSFGDFLVRPSAPHPCSLEEMNPVSKFFFSLRTSAKKATLFIPEGLSSLRGAQYLEYVHLYHDGHPPIIFPYEEEARRLHQRYVRGRSTFRGCRCLPQLDVVLADMRALRTFVSCQEDACVVDSDLITLCRMMEMPVDEFLRRWMRHEFLRPIAFSVLKVFMWLRVMLSGLFDPSYALYGIVHTLMFRLSSLTLPGGCVAIGNGLLCIMVLMNTRWEGVLLLYSMYYISMLGY